MMGASLAVIAVIAGWGGVATPEGLVLAAVLALVAHTIITGPTACIMNAVVEGVGSCLTVFAFLGFAVWLLVRGDA